MAEGISNTLMDDIYTAAKKAGASGGKISGAGGGGFMIFYCPGNTKFTVMDALANFGGYCKNYQFVDHGLTTLDHLKLHTNERQNKKDHFRFHRG